MSKTCFVIAPIGEVGSETRQRSDQVLNYIIAPAVRSCDYEPLRADQISEPGIITSQVIQHIVEDPLVIADLTERNANVFYELSLRHALRKPCVQMIHKKELIPFDVAATRTIRFDHHDLGSAEEAKEQIARQIRAVESNPGDMDTPISSAIELQRLQRSDNPIERSNAEIMAAINELRSDLRHDPRSDMDFAVFRTQISEKLWACRSLLDQSFVGLRRMRDDVEDLTRNQIPWEALEQRLRRYVEDTERNLTIAATLLARVAD